MNDTLALGQLHSFEPLDAETLAAHLADRLDARWLDRRAVLEVSISVPWRPCDLWEGGLVRPVWTATFSGDLPFWAPGGEAEVGHLATLAKRQAPVSLAELCAEIPGSALVVVYSDATRSAYAAVWRERQLRWSLRLDDGVLAARCDGDRVIVESPPRPLPEIDRVGVLVAGLSRFFTEMPALEGVDRLLLPDVLLALDAETVPVRYSRADLFGSATERAVAGK